MEPPTFSWWALVSPVTLARCGSGRRPSGGRSGGGGGPIGEEIEPPPPSPVSSDTTRSDGKVSDRGEGKSEV